MDVNKDGCLKLFDPTFTLTFSLTLFKELSTRRSSSAGCDEVISRFCSFLSILKVT